MSAENFYRPVESYSIKSYTLDNFQGEPIPTKNLPFKEGHIEAFSIVGNSRRKSRNKHPRLIQTTEDHGRTFEMRFNDSGYIIWEDEYSNIYGMLTSKGNNVDQTATYKDHHAPSGFVFNGLLDSDSLVLLLRASQLAREKRIDTEIIVKIMEPEALPYDKELLTIPEVKKRHLDVIWEGKNKTKRRLGTGSIDITDHSAVGLALKDINFYTAVRGVQVNERFSDLKKLEAGDKEKFNDIMTRIFTFVNLKEEILARRNSSYKPEHFDANNHDDMLRYFSIYLPFAIGRNYGRLHNAGLLHKFPHLGNISLVGSIYDLDSMIGEPLGLGDKPVTEEEKVKEFDYIAYGSDSHQLAGGVLNSVAGLVNKGFLGGLEESVSTQFRNSLFLAYINERGWDKDIVPNAYNLCSLYRHFNGLGEIEIENYFLEKVIDQVGWDHAYSGTLGDVLKGFPEYLRTMWTDDILKRGSKDKIALGMIEDLFEYIQIHMNEAIREDHEEQLSLIEDTNDEDVTNSIIIMFSDREAEKIREELTVRFKDGTIYPMLNECLADFNIHFDRSFIRRFLGGINGDSIFANLNEDSAVTIFFTMLRHHKKVESDEAFEKKNAG